ncbi:MAG TPA: hypothetical protein VJ695_09105 [Nitrososphaera sp.]|nr:hypothetical protein [Nitrososphaera sp.]
MRLHSSLSQLNIKYTRKVREGRKDAADYGKLSVSYCHSTSSMAAVVAAVVAPVLNVPVIAEIHHWTKCLTSILANSK